MRHNGIVIKSAGMIIAKRILLLVTGLVLLMALCGCKSQTDGRNAFAEGSLLFDIGAKSMENIEYCKIIDEGAVSEIAIGEEDFDLLAKYRYKSVYPSDKLHELLVFPQNKLINIRVDGKAFELYLMKDGNIGVRISEEGFVLYQADENNRITPQKYDELVNKYSQ